jgi:bifunctional non-homologous end joining protein LigD
VPATEDRLTTYRDMRRFDATPEPAGAPQPKGDHPEPEAEAEAAGGRYVVQRHRATRLHYDFRLEVDGVLASWAVPKGPTLDPGVRRQAIHVEDHPIEYFDFEGVIPKGQYGGGDVIVWDWGHWYPAKGSVEEGELHFDLDGERLKGRFVLVKTAHKSGKKEQWLLLHKHDEHAVDGWDAEDHPASVKTGRTNDQVLAAPDAKWHSGKDAAEAEERLRPEIPTWDPPTEDELAALDALGPKGGEWELQGRTLKLTNLDKVLFPARADHDDEKPVTKRELIRYAAEIGPWILPYLWDRAVNLHRYPNGAGKPGFWHKEVPDHAPDWITRWHNDDAEPDETQWYFVADSVPTLAWLANYGAIELNPWTSSTRSSHEPTWALIDVDPGPSTTWEELLLLTRLYRTALEHLGVSGQPKVTGKRGIQIWVPIAGGCRFDDTRAAIEDISRAIGRTVPELVSWEWTKKDRKGLARLDYTQNARNKTLIAPFSTRPSPGAPVSVPIEWDELDDDELRPDRWTIRTVFDRLAEAGDPLRPLIGMQQRLPTL